MVQFKRECLIISFSIISLLCEWVCGDVFANNNNYEQFKPKIARIDPLVWES